MFHYSSYGFCSNYGVQIVIVEVKRYVEEWFDWMVDMDLFNISIGLIISVC